jgi:hypothetical protein
LFLSKLSLNSIVYKNSFFLILMLFSFIYLGEINVVSALELIITLALSLLTRMLMLILLLTA